MKWDVTLPDGEVVESNGAAYTDAATNAVRRHMLEPKTDEDKPFACKVRRSRGTKFEMDKVYTVHFKPCFYWSSDFESTFQANRDV